MPREAVCLAVSFRARRNLGKKSALRGHEINIKRPREANFPPKLRSTPEETAELGLVTYWANVNRMDRRKLVSAGLKKHFRFCRQMTVVYIKYSSFEGMIYQEFY